MLNTVNQQPTRKERCANVQYLCTSTVCSYTNWNLKTAYTRKLSLFEIRCYMK